MTIRFQKKLTHIGLCIGIFLALACPAHADTALAYGFDSANAVAMLSVLTRGIAAIAIIVIEAWFFVRYWHYKWFRALSLSFVLNLASTLGGFVMGFVYMMNLEATMAAMLLFPILFFILIFPRHPPGWFYLATIPIFLAGAYSGIVLSRISEPVSRLMLFFMIELSLLTGFGLSLMIESIVASVRNFENNFWKTITLANVASYVLLIFLFPFFAANPYLTNYRTDFKFIEDPGNQLKDDPAKTIELLHLYRSDVPSLTGFNLNNLKSKEYSAFRELGFLQRQSGSEIAEHPRTIEAIIKDALEVPNLTQIAKDRLVWMQQYMDFVLQAKENIVNKDQAGLDKTYSEWKAWREKNLYRGEVEGFESIDEKIGDLIKWGDSNLKNPGKMEQDVEKKRT